LVNNLSGQQHLRFRFTAKRLGLIRSTRIFLRTVRHFRTNLVGPEMRQARALASAAMKPVWCVCRLGTPVYGSAGCLSCIIALSACESNSFVPPQPPKVEVPCRARRSRCSRCHGHTPRSRGSTAWRACVSHRIASGRNLRKSTTLCHDRTEPTTEAEHAPAAEPALSLAETGRADFSASLPRAAEAVPPARAILRLHP